MNYKILGGDGNEYGPASAETVRKWVAEGRANRHTKILPEGAVEWQTLGESPEFAAEMAAPEAPPASQPAPTPMPLSTPPSARPKTNALAVAGLVLGCLSMTCGLCCYGLPFNVAGIICAVVALAQIKRDAAAQSGRGLAIAGLVLSLLSILVSLVLLVLGLALDSSGWMREIERWGR